MHLLFAGMYQGTRNSSEITRNAAEQVTRGVGGKYFEISVDEIVERYTTAIEQAIDRKLTWQHDDIALQNIQARTRSPSVWMLTNIRNALLLSTSNRSEAAVGYATMDGDTSGGLSPIAGIDKAFLREWLRIFELHGSAGVKPVSALRLVNAQQPTAELRPSEYEQTDERRFDAVSVAGPHRATGDTRQAESRRNHGDAATRTSGIQCRAAHNMGSSVLHAVVPKSVETRTLRAIVSCR